MLEALQRIKLHFYCCSIGGDWIFIFENDFGNFNIKPTIGPSLYRNIVDLATLCKF